MKPPTGTANWLTTLIVVLIALAVVTPAIVALADALLPLVIVAAIGAIAVRLVFVHTRRW